MDYSPLYLAQIESLQLTWSASKFVTLRLNTAQGTETMKWFRMSKILKKHHPTALCSQAVNTLLHFFCRCNIAWEETASVRFIRGLFYLKEWVQLSWPRRARTFDKAAWMSGSIVLCNSLLITFLDGLTSVTLQYWGVHSLPSSSPLLNIFYKIVQKKIFEALPCKSTLLIAGLMWTCYVPGFPISLSARLSDNPECRIDLNSWQISDLEIINYFPSPARVSHVWQHTTLASLSVQNPPDDVLMWYCHIVTGTSFSLRGVRQCYNIMTGHRGIVQMTRTLAWICIYAALLMMVIHIPVNILKTSKIVKFFIYILAKPNF